MKPVEKYVAIFFLLFSIGFNLWLYRAEPTTTIDPNDNAFQFALVERTYQMWDYASRVCPRNLLIINCKLSILSDHWVPNWAEGYNLPYYYSHVPQILIVGSYRLFHLPISLFQYYHYIIYVLLCFFPLSVFLATRVLRYSWFTAGIAALLASQISTDGLYGIDQSSFLWRGWGLSSQLFALIWFPLAIASIIQFVKTYQVSRIKYQVWLPVFFLTATTTGHLGIGMMAFLAIPIICLSQTLMSILEKQKQRIILEACIQAIKQIVLLALPPLIILSYWIVPALLNNNYHNISVWDPVWKFNSYGAKEVVTMLVNGQLFDFGRFPIFTMLIFIGLFATIQNGFSSIAFLFLFFLLLFFGRTTWGGLLNLIPGMSEFHQHRFLVGVHLAGLFLAPIGLTWIVSRFRPFIKFIIVIIFISIIVPQTIKYASYNTTLIHQANEAYIKAKPDFDLLLSTFYRLQSTSPGRIYALRGSEGKAFEIASTPYYMQLSTYGLPTVLWMPETWSMNSDTEQFFVEENISHYDLYNIRYVVTNPEKKSQPFWKLLKETEHWKLYGILKQVQDDNTGYITIGTAPSIVSAKKTDIINLIHLWIQSDYPKQLIFPELRSNEVTKLRTNDILPHFRMIDPTTYQTPDGVAHSLFAEIPSYLSPLSNLSDLVKITSQSDDTDMVFKATVEVKTPCPTCVVVLKQTYHPNWKVIINGKSTKTINVFPSFVGVRLETPGTYDIIFSY
ncbi:MAG: hypothetical protein ACD_48C00387G0002 [uncultured bacterium]|nr:MAG: hypothetical protein ACD_48C00387G0002 [uncultured bacterium]